MLRRTLIVLKPTWKAGISVEHGEAYDAIVKQRSKLNALLARSSLEASHFMDDRDILSNVPIFASLDERSRMPGRSCVLCALAWQIGEAVLVVFETLPHDPQDRRPAETL